MRKKQLSKFFNVLIFEILDLDEKELSSIKNALNSYLKKLSPMCSIKTIAREENKVTIELDLSISSNMVALVEKLIVSTINELRIEQYFSTEEKDMLWKKLDIRLIDLPVSRTTLTYFKSQPTYLGRFVGQLVRRKFNEIASRNPRIISKTSLNEVVEILKGFGLSLGMKKIDLAGWIAPSSANAKILHEKEEKKVEQLPISMDTPLSILDKYDVSSHTLSRLGKHYRTVGELCQATEADLRAQGRTKKPIQNIQKALKKLGLKLKE